MGQASSIQVQESKELPRDYIFDKDGRTVLKRTKDGDYKPIKMVGQESTVCEKKNGILMEKAEDNLQNPKISKREKNNKKGPINEAVCSHQNPIVKQDDLMEAQDNQPNTTTPRQYPAKRAVTPKGPPTKRKRRNQCWN